VKHHKQVPAHDPAEDYNEWIRNRYNPGYYLGGRISPLMRASQRLFTGTEKRVGAVLLFARASCLLWPPLCGGYCGNTAERMPRVDIVRRVRAPLNHLERRISTAPIKSP
jgi:hypothetical protein